MVQALTCSQYLYPDSDGKPMAENTLQYRWIVRLVTNLKRLFQDQVVFVAGDLLWYPVPVEKPPPGSGPGTGCDGGVGASGGGAGQLQTVGGGQRCSPGGVRDFVP